MQFLLGRGLPEGVRSLAERLKASRVVQSLRPVLNRLLGPRPREGEGRIAELMARRRRRSEGQAPELVLFAHGTATVVARSVALKDGRAELTWFDRNGVKQHTFAEAMPGLKTA